MADILIESSIFPPIPISFAQKAGGSGQPSLALRLLKPRIRVLTPDGSALVDEAPAGAPGNTWPIVIIVAGAVVALVLALAVKGAID